MHCPHHLAVKPARSEEPNEPWVYGAIYHSTDFNGATYTIEKTGAVIGSAYFQLSKIHNDTSSTGRSVQWKQCGISYGILYWDLKEWK